VVKLVKIEESEKGEISLLVEGADLLDGTPILDVKPYLPHADCVLNAVGGYADGVENHRLKVVFEKELAIKIDEEKLQGLIDCLADDPRPSYQDDDRTYSMRFSDVDVRFKVEDGVLTVVEVVNLKN
jgi:hypothetical protein